LLAAANRRSPPSKGCSEKKDEGAKNRLCREGGVEKKVRKEDIYAAVYRIEKKEGVKKKSRA